MLVRSIKDNMLVIGNRAAFNWTGGLSGYGVVDLTNAKDVVLHRAQRQLRKVEVLRPVWHAAVAEF